MKLKQNFIIGLLSIVVMSCSNSRIELITEKSGLKLPEKYTIIKNETESSGIQDYEINVILKFDEKAFNQITTQIDSLKKVNKYWIKNSGSMKYQNNSNESEPERIFIDIESKTLEFKLVHI